MLIVGYTKQFISDSNTTVNTIMLWWIWPTDWHKWVLNPVSIAVHSSLSASLWSAYEKQLYTATHTTANLEQHDLHNETSTMTNNKTIC